MSNKIKITKLGFTVIELIIVISIVGIVAAASFVMFDEARNKAVLQNAQASVINALEQARSRAATGVGTTTHGVCIKNNKIISFRGNVCTTTAGVGEEISLPPNTSATSSADVIFNRLSAMSSANATITLEYKIGITTIATTVSITQDGIIKK